MKNLIICLGIFALVFWLSGCDEKPSSNNQNNSSIIISPSASNKDKEKKDHSPIILSEAKPEKSEKQGTEIKGKEEITGPQLDSDASKEAQLGLSYFKQEKENEAFEVWTAAIESNEKDTNALFCLAQYYWDNGEEEDALDLYRKFFTANPSRNLKKQVGRTFNSATVNSYDELTDILKNRDSKKEQQKMVNELTRQIRECKMNIKNAERREEPAMIQFYQEKQKELEEELSSLMNN